MALTLSRTIRPTPSWQDSLIRVGLGQRVVIDAEDVWSPDMRDQIAWCGADGLYNRTAGTGYLMPGVNIGALVIRIGSGPAIAVGSRYDFIADREGVIYFAMNENPAHTSQAGKVTAQVIVFDLP